MDHYTRELLLDKLIFNESIDLSTLSNYEIDELIDDLLPIAKFIKENPYKPDFNLDYLLY